VISLLSNKNVFWSPEIFYGSLDRHNREYTSEEVVHALHEAGFAKVALDYYNSYSNWNSKLPKIFHPLARMATEGLFVNRLLKNPFLYNTIVAIVQKSGAIECSNGGESVSFNFGDSLIKATAIY